MGDHRVWRTQVEIAFINHLGTGRHRDRSHDATRADLLAGYISGIRHRREWGSLDRSKIFDRATQELTSAHKRENLIA